MLSLDRAAAQLPYTLRETKLPLSGLRRGKVRDVYELGDRLLLVATDRLSAFDVILTTVPYKGQILTALAAHWFEVTADLAENHVLGHPDPCVLLARRCTPLPIEVVVRGYLTGSLWRDVERGSADVYGVPIPRGMRKDARFDAPIVTPSTKAAIGAHDEPISEAAIVERGLVERAIWQECRRLALLLFARGQAHAASRGLLLVDTKYEFGLYEGRVILIDEIHTPDSSRYWEASEYEARFAAAEEQRMLDKENIRQWLIRERGFSGAGAAPTIPDRIRCELSQTYASTFERVTGRAFAPQDGDPHGRLERNLRTAGLM